MANSKLGACPKCGKAMGRGFAAKSAGLSFVAPEKLDHLAFIDEDLGHAGLKKFLPAKAEFFRSYLCRPCKVYLVEYGRSFSRKEAEQAAAER
ncbi:MAG: hypothetical protein HYY17_04565 [Planctomycetes bacterium]|nr:hypothetical protein [Planctomycetota bacterium]